MNYELKSIAPLSVFLNSIRIFLIVGFVVAIFSFFIMPNPTVRIPVWWQKILATLFFTLVYGTVVSLVFTFIASLYNFWTKKFGGIRVRFEQD